MNILPLENAGAAHIGYQQRVKEDNIKRIFDLVRGGKCKSRAELVRAMQLSATSVSGLVEELSASGLITETGPQQTSQPGRRPISLRFNADARQIVVFSVGCQGVQYTLLNLGCEVMERLFVPVDASSLDLKDSGDIYAGVFEDLLFHRAKKFDPQRAQLIGMTYPGHYVEADRAICLRTLLHTSVSLDALLRFQKRVNLPFYLGNRTMCMAYAEKTSMEASDAAGAADLLFVTVRNGISGALIYGGSLFSGPTNVAGEIGHVSIDCNGLPCVCGNTGCLERYVNQNAILENAQKACADAGLEPPPSLEALAERYLDVLAVAQTLDHAADLLAHGLYSALCVSGVRRVILGGGIEVLGERFLRRLYRDLCARSLLIRHLDLSYAQLGADSDSIGLVQYYLDKHFTITI